MSSRRAFFTERHRLPAMLSLPAVTRHIRPLVAESKGMAREMPNMKKLIALSFQLNGCNSMSCGGFSGLFFRWNSCKQPPIGYNGLGFVEAPLREGWQSMNFKCMSFGLDRARSISGAGQMNIEYRTRNKIGRAHV